MDIQIDDLAFKNLLNDTQVLLGKDVLKWNWPSIMEMLNGPLLNPKRLEEVLKSTKFVKRLLSFFGVRKNKFAAVKRGRASQRYVDAGCALMRALINCPEGVKYLSESVFLPEFAECLRELAPVSKGCENVVLHTVSMYPHMA